MDKSALFDAVRAALTARLADLRRQQAEATSGTRVDHERPANRGERGAVTGQGYLALGLGQRAADLAETLTLLDRIPATPRDRVATGAVVTVADDDGAPTTLLVLPGGEALSVEVDGTPVVVVSPDAPLVRGLLGLGEGDVGRVQRGGAVVDVEVVAVG